MAKAVPSETSGARVHQGKIDQPQPSIPRKWTGHGLERTAEQSSFKAGNLKELKQEQQGSFNTPRNATEKAGIRGRQNSLRRVKNSKEVLRQRSANRDNKGVAPDGLSGGREGRQFTVANVGNNGRIYLRYVYRNQIKAPLARCQKLSEYELRSCSLGRYRQARNKSRRCRPLSSLWIRRRIARN